MTADCKAGAYHGGGIYGVAVELKTAKVVGKWAVQEMTPDEMVEMAEHLLANARHSAGRNSKLLIEKRQCGVYYGTGSGSAVCGRPLGHPEYQEDKLGHARWPTKADGEREKSGAQG